MSHYYFAVSGLLLSISLVGLLLNRRTAIMTLISIELLFLSVIIAFVGASAFSEAPEVGFSFTIYVMSIAAAESAIALAIIVKYFREKGNLDVTKASVLNG